MAMKKIIDPVFEARTDWDIFDALSQRLGVQEAWRGGRDEMGWIRSIYDAAFQMAGQKKIPMPDFDTFWNGSGVAEFEVPAAARKWTKYGDFRDDPLLNSLPTPSGKIEIFSKKIADYHYDDCPGHPSWIEPAERMGRSRFAFHVVSSHPELRLHSQLCGAEVVRRLYSVSNREPCWINTADAAKLGIKTGDIVRLHNERGQVLAGAFVTDDIRPGVLRLQEGGWYDPAEPKTPGSVCRYGDVNVLSPDVGTSRLAQGTSAASIMADVEKFSGPVPPVGVFSTPVGA
jgi:trimethylamine-N-oxide reductase (cytochrome c)